MQPDDASESVINRDKNYVLIIYSGIPIFLALNF